MTVDFKWQNPPSKDNQDNIESEVLDILHREDIKGCHPGVMLIHLSIVGPLDYTLEGRVECQCGKILTDFKGSINGITQYRKPPRPPRKRGR